MTDEARATPSETDESDARPLRWWERFLPRTPAQTVIGVLAVMFLAGAIGYVIGTREATSDTPSGDSVDVGFLYDMVAHHEQAAVLAALELTNGDDPTAKLWAREILRSQSYEIGLMEMKLGQLGHDPSDRPATAMRWMGMDTTHQAMPGMATEAELDALRSARGEEADALFYALMIDHHLGGVAMARQAAEQASDDWVADTAAVMASIQADEIAEMRHARDDAGLPADPAGYAPDHDAGQGDHDG